MNHRQRALAVLNYQSYDRLPVVHFGFWARTMEVWADQGHFDPALVADWQDGNAADQEIGRLLGFDFNWYSVFGADVFPRPAFERRIIEECPDGSRKVFDSNGAIILEKPGIVSIPTEIDHLLKGRAAWEEHYKPRLRWTPDRLDLAEAATLRDAGRRDLPRGLWCGSLYGRIRNWMGLVGLSYISADDPRLLDEMIETVAELCYQGVKATLEAGAQLDFGHFWEDICYNHGPLVNPRFFKAGVGPHYRRITDLLHGHGISLVSLDCDGKIDALIPTWFENGVNVMFPIEVGTWDASIAPWRAQYGRELRGVGGMNKVVFSRDYAAVDEEVERLRRLVDLGGYIPCPDHRIAPDARWENVQYYCERMRRVFG